MFVQTTPEETQPIDRDLATGPKPDAPNETIVFLLALAIISCAGFALLQIAAKLGLTDSWRDLHGFIMDPYRAFVKSRDSFLFVTLTAFGPFAIGLAIAILQRFPVRRWRNGAGAARRINAYGSLIFLAFVISLLLTDETFRSVPAYAFAAPVLLVACIFIAFPIVAFGEFPERVSRLAFGISIALVGLASVALTLLTLTVRIDMITGSGAFWNHLDPVMFSVGQAVNGGKCLATLIPQYGCYAQFIAPLLKWVGPSLLHATLIMATLQLVALGASFAFIVRVVENRLCALTCCIFLLGLQDTTGFMGGGYAYLQYWPIRTLFPALGLFVVAWWPRRTTWQLSVAAGAFGGCAVLWNVDSGVVVLIALALFVGVRSFDTDQRRLTDVALNLLTYSLCSGVVLIGYAYWAEPSSITTALTNALFYQRTFYLTGLVSEPTPSIPAAWCAALALSGLALVLYACELRDRRTSARSHAIFFLAILAVGIFQYYTGRSLPPVFSAVSWPFVILGFYLLSRVRATKDNGAFDRLRSITFKAVSALLATFMVSILIQCGASLPAFYQMHFMATNQLGAELSSDVGFIRTTAAGSRDVAILDTYGAELLLESDKRFGLASRTLQEMVRRSDFENLLNAIGQRGPENLYIGNDLLHSTEADIGYARILSSDGMPKFARHYAFVRWNPTGQLAYYQRRAFVEPARPPAGLLPRLPDRRFHAVFVPAIGGFVDDANLPYMKQFTIATGKDRSFSLDLRVRPAAHQPYVSTIVSNHCCFRGVAVEALGLPNQYRLVLGDGSKWNVFPFFIEDARTSRVTISYREDTMHLFVAVDGMRVYDRSGVAYAPSGLPLTVGNWHDGDRPFTGVEEFAYYPRAISYATRREALIPCVGSPEVPRAATSEPDDVIFESGFEPPAVDARGAYRLFAHDSTLAIRNAGPRRDTITLTAYVRTNDGRSGILQIIAPGSSQSIPIGGSDTRIVMAVTAETGVAVRLRFHESAATTSAVAARSHSTLRIERMTTVRSGCIP